MNNIIYISGTCSQSRFDRLVHEGKIRRLPQAQKYHHLLLEGLSLIDDLSITSVSTYTIKDKIATPRRVDIENGIEYIYPSTINFPVLRQLSLYITATFELWKQFKPNSVFICDVLNIPLVAAAKTVRLLKRNKIIAIITDLPGYTTNARVKLLPKWKQMLLKYYKLLTDKWSIRNYDGYLFLTDAMNGVVNKSLKPYIVLEGHADIAMSDMVNNLSDKSRPKVIMYAGGIHKEFGIPLLVDAFIAANVKDWELHIYGDGNYQQELLEVTKQYNNIKYFGLQPNSIVVNAQLKASLMVNPRITNAEYVKYSFPSKTLECMVSGTPLLTTRLAGMPADYFPYVYLFEEETVSGFVSTLEEVLSKTPEEMHDYGLKAKHYAIANKNNKIQALKFYSFIKQIVR